jgi:hypothetical protein
MKTVLNILTFVLSFGVTNAAFSFQEKALTRAMGQRNFSSSLMSSAMDVARDLEDKTGCLHKTNLTLSTDKFVICDLNEIMTEDSRCHMLNTSTNLVEASGPVAFGEKGVSHLEGQADGSNKMTLLGAFIATPATSKKSNDLKLIRYNGTELPKALNPVLKTDSRRVPASTKGSPLVVGEFAKKLKNEASNMIWVNHSVKHPYDNSCGQAVSRRVYETDMNDVQLAEYRAKMNPKNPAKQEPKRGIASEKE